MLEGNVTFSNHTAGQAPLQYISQFGTAANLSASLDSRTANPIDINPMDVYAPGVLQNDTAAGTKWELTSQWHQNLNSIAGGAVESIASVVQNGQRAIAITANTSGAASTMAGYYIELNSSAWPSTNLAFDYITAAMTLTGAPNSGVYATIGFENSSSAAGYWIGGYSEVAEAATNASTAVNPIVTGPSPIGAGEIRPGGTLYVTISLEQLNTVHTTFNSTSRTTSVLVFVICSLPKEVSTPYTMTLSALALTTMPLTFGATTWKTKNVTSAVQGQIFNGSVNLTTLSPTFSYSYITGGGYTVAITQAASSLPDSAVNTAQTPISRGPYVEQVTYSFMLGLNAAPGLTYGAFKLTDRVTLAPAQYVSVTYAGTSYLGDYTAAGVKGNYTTLVSAASPTINESWVGTVQFTQAQWNSITSAPGLFTLAGIAYYWYVAIGVIASALIGGSAWASRNASEERVIRGRK